jgi:hypothetical protein
MEHIGSGSDGHSRSSSARKAEGNRQLTASFSVVFGVFASALGVLSVIGYAVLPFSTLQEKGLVIGASLALALATTFGIGAWQSLWRFVVTATLAACCIVLLCDLAITAASGSSSVRQGTYGTSKQPVTAPTTLPQASASASTVPSPTAGPSASNATVTALYKGTVEFGNDGIDFDLNPPTARSGSTTLFIDNPPLNILSSSPQIIMVTWPQSQKPTEADCQNLTTTHPVSSPILVHIGLQLCISTVENNVVYLKVTGTDDTDGLIDAYVIVWSS